MAGDGQVTLGNVVMKHSAKKIRRLYKDQILAGFAGSAADAFTLFTRFESKLETHKGQLLRAVVELAGDWRADKMHGQGVLVWPDGKRYEGAFENDAPHGYGTLYGPSNEILFSATWIGGCIDDGGRRAAIIPGYGDCGDD